MPPSVVQVTKLTPGSGAHPYLTIQDVEWEASKLAASSLRPLAAAAAVAFDQSRNHAGSFGIKPKVDRPNARVEPALGCID
jgi:hypothetical protein